jgi:hypothetical protein
LAPAVPLDEVSFQKRRFPRKEDIPQSRRDHKEKHPGRERLVPHVLSLRTLRLGERLKGIEV